MQIDTGTGIALGVITLVCLVLIVLFGNDSDDDDPNDGWR